jgi:hypothetical protein
VILRLLLQLVLEMERRIFPGNSRGPTDLPAAQLPFPTKFPGDVLVLVPDGSVPVYVTGGQMEIEWLRNPSAHVQDVQISLMRGGSSHRFSRDVMIADRTPNTGRFIWTIPDGLSEGSTFLVQVVSAKNLLLCSCATMLIGFTGARQLLKAPHLSTQ